MQFTDTLRRSTGEISFSVCCHDFALHVVCLNSSYWYTVLSMHYIHRTFGEVHPQMDQLLEFDRQRSNASYGIGTYLMLTLVLLLALISKRLRIKATGRHKKTESSFSRSKKYRDS